MQKCPTCSQRGLSVVGVIFMIHDERVTCEKCGTSFTIPKSRKSLVIGLEYTFILMSVAASLMVKNMAPLGVVLILIAIARYFVLPQMAVEHKREINRLRKYRRK